MSEDIRAGDERRLGAWDDTLPEPPDHGADADLDEGEQPEPEEVSDAVLDQ